MAIVHSDSNADDYQELKTKIEQQTDKSRDCESVHDALPSQQGNRLTFGFALTSMALLWLSFPPVGFWPLAWIAPAPLIWLCACKRPPGARPYRAIWLAGLLYWLATFYFVPIPHWALWFGWMTVSLYMSLYTILFVGATRTLVHTLRIPILIAAPVAWTGVEWLRCVFLTGMGMACLSHSQYGQPILIQVADLFGAYTLSFFMVMFASSIVGLPIFASHFERNTNWINAVGAIVSIGFVLGYGQFRLSEVVDIDDSADLKIALIQGSVDTDLSAPDEVMKRKFDQYCQLTWQARENSADLDLIVWPEGNLPLYDLVPELGRPRNQIFESYDSARAANEAWQVATAYPGRFKRPVQFLAGTLGSYGVDTVYNSAILIDEHGTITDRYFKNHRVMFGEYFPILEWMPSFSTSFPSTTAGTKPASFELKNDITLAPTICFETTVPHFVRKQINELAAAGDEPDCLINLTNDGWFYGTSCLDLHLACNVFRAVELRKTNLVCANTGFSAEIDRCGRILQRGPRRDVRVLKVTVNKQRANRRSLYREMGDFIPITMGVICLIAAGIGWRFRIRR